MSQRPVHSIERERGKEGKGEKWLKLPFSHWQRPYKTCIDVIIINFSLLMLPSSGGLNTKQASSSEIEGVSPNPCLLQRLYPPPKFVCHPSVIHNLHS